MHDLEGGIAEAAVAQTRAIEEVVGCRAQVAEALEEVARGREELTAMASRLDDRINELHGLVADAKSEVDQTIGAAATSCSTRPAACS